MSARTDRLREAIGFGPSRAQREQAWLDELAVEARKALEREQVMYDKGYGVGMAEGMRAAGAELAALSLRHRSQVARHLLIQMARDWGWDGTFNSRQTEEEEGRDGE